MLSTTSWTYTLKITISISILGLAIVALLAANPPSVQPVPWRMQMVSFIFGSLCILGVIAVFFPSMCSGMISPGREPENNERDISTRRYASIFGVKVVHGHHTLSKEFIDHEFQIGSKTFCAGCSGLLIGALVSVTGLFAYSTLNVEMRIVAPFLVGIGIVVIATVLLFPLLHKQYSYSSLSLNIHIFRQNYNIFVPCSSSGKCISLVRLL